MADSYPLYFFIVGFGILISGLSLLSIEKSAPQSLPGGKYWALGGIFIFVGFLLIGADEWLPEFISTTFANGLFPTAVAFYYLAINHVIGHQSNSKLIIAILGFTYLGEIIFTSLLPNYSVRMLILLTALVVLSLLCILQLRFPSEPGELAPKIMMIVLFSIAILLFLWRIATELIDFNPQKTIAQLGLVLDVTVSAAFVLSSLITISFLLLSNAVNYSKIRRLAYEDSLTETYSRRAIMDKIFGAIAESDRSGIPFSIILIDFDNLKGINDTVGHQAGDEALKKISNSIKSSLRGGDAIGRFGGDEFIVLIRNVNIKGSKVVIERLLAVIRSIKYSFNKPVHVSIGGALYEPGKSSLDELITLADKNLYAVKGKGGDGFHIT